MKRRKYTEKQKNRSNISLTACLERYELSVFCVEYDPSFTEAMLYEERPSLSKRGVQVPELIHQYHARRSAMIRIWLQSVHNLKLRFNLPDSDFIMYCTSKLRSILFAITV